MRLNLNKIPFLQKHELRKHAVSFPSFIPIQPYGLNSGDVESISSYLCRQSETSSESSHPFNRRFLERYAEDGDMPSCLKVPARGLHCSNGVGVMATRHAHALNNAIQGLFDASTLTLLPLKHLCDTKARGLMREHLTWCSQCWKSDIHIGQTPYVRLYWLFQHTRICVIHNSRLSEFCPSCGEVKSVYPAFPRQWLCDKCGEELTKSDSNFSANNFTAQDEWISHSLYHLLDRIYSQKLSVRQNQVQIAIKRFLRSFDLSAESFADRLNLDVNIVRRLLEGSSKPYFSTLLDLSYRLDIPLDQFLFDRDVLTSPDLWRNLPTPAFEAHSKLTSKQKKLILRQINRILKRNPCPPIRVSHFARKHNISHSTLYYNFPNEYRELRKRYSSWVMMERRTQHTQRLENLCGAIFSLVRQGVYPSDRKLRDLDILRQTDIRREDVQVILRAFQEIYSSYQTE